MDASLIFLAILVIWLLGLFPHLIRRRTQIVDAARVDRLPGTVRIVGSESHDRIGGTRSTAAILPTAAARTAANNQLLDVNAMDGNQVGTPSTNSTPVRPARPVRRDNSARPAPAPETKTVPDTAARARAKERKIRIRRLGVGFVGLAAITVVSAVLAALSIVTWGIPLAGLVLAVVDLFVLRAVHTSARGTVARSVQEQSESAEAARPARRPAKTEAQSHSTHERKTVRKVASSRDVSESTRAKTRSSVSMAATAFPSTARSTTQKPAESTDKSDGGEPTRQPRAGRADAVKRPATRSKSSVSWSPVPVPRPTYLDAPKVERAEPAPLVVDASVHDKVEQPEVSDTARTLSETEAKESAARQWVEEPGERPEVEDAGQLTVNKTAAQVSRLDDVLQRRRAVGE